MGKLDYYSEMCSDAVSKICSDNDYYRSFLRTSARLYKHSFDTQIMVHEQNPEVVACADFDTWTNKDVHRHIKKNSKGMGVVDRSGTKPVLHYMYDYSDTEPIDSKSKSPYIWEITAEKRAFVNQTLNGGHGLDSTLIETAKKLAEDYAAENLRELSARERTSFTELLENSTAYMLLSRCGYDPDMYYSSEDLSAVSEYDSIGALCRIGCAISGISEKALRAIEKSVKSYDRGKEDYERGNPSSEYAEQYRLYLQRENRNISAGFEIGGNEFAVTREIRNAPQEVPVGTQGGIVFGIGDNGAAVHSLSRNGEIGGATAESYNRTDEAGAGSDGTVQGGTSNGVGRTDEQRSGGSGRNRAERVDLQLNKAQNEINKAGLDNSPAVILSKDTFDVEPDLNTGKGEQIFLFAEENSEEEVEIPVEMANDFVLEWYICNEDGEPLSNGYATRSEAESHFHEYADADYIDGVETFVENDISEIAQEQNVENSPLDGEAHEFIGNDTITVGTAEPVKLNSIVIDLTARNVPQEYVRETPDIVTDQHQPEVGDIYFTQGVISPEYYLIDEIVGDRANYSIYFDENCSERRGGGTVYIDNLVNSEQYEFVGKHVEFIQSTLSDIPISETEVNATEIDSPMANNFRITDETLGVGGDKAKFRANIEAIKTLKKVESEHRNATPDEQETLSKYVGWGGLSQAFDNKYSAWSNEYSQLKALLTESEYESARASVNNAHYTTPVVINAIYEGISNLGFKGGNILEPALGVGNFFGVMPEEMRKNSALSGVETDSISGRIAQKLYPSAKIQITGFENTDFKDGTFDVVVGNVPFGDYKLSERRYDKLRLRIHDHFFVKSLDKVREGGVVAFVTSKGTLDKANPKVRQYLAERADLLGAIRLPGGENGAFKANAGTEVTTDIIFLQKKAEPQKNISPDWVRLGMTKDGIPVNKYFEQHPEMILGEMRRGVEFSMYGNPEATTCVPFEGSDLREQLKAAVANIKGSIPERKSEKIYAKLSGKADKNYSSNPDIIYIDYENNEYSDVRNFSYTEIDGEIYFREGSEIRRQNLSEDAKKRIGGMIEISKCVRTLIDFQLNEYPESAIKEQQAELNELYNDFTAKYGLISSEKNSRVFREDSSYFLLSSLEILDENGKLERKADMFTKRTIKPKIEITSVDTAAEALAVSLSEKAKVDIPFMAGLSGLSEEETIAELRGVIYRVPKISDDGGQQEFVTADEYLSGNIREKLEIAKLVNKSLGDNSLADNISALEQVMPTPLDASEIEVRLGTNWIPPKYIRQFIFETLHTSFINQREINVYYSPHTTEWRIDGKSKDQNNIASNTMFGTERKNAYSIIEDTLNMRDARVYDYFVDEAGKTHSVLNHKETELAQEKQELIKNAFKDWIFKDPERREWLVDYYNEHFNATRPREYDGSHLSLVGMNPEITLRPHQLNAIAHTIYGGNTLLAHQVGAGKTYEMVASAMESKRLGLCSKSLFVVPNHITEQIGAEFLRLYPTANVLVATEKDFELKNRKRLCARIATGNYDAVIIGHSQLEKIPVSRERQERLLRQQINDIVDGIAQAKEHNSGNFSIKQLEKTKKNLEARLKSLLDSPKRDDVVTFEELGIDKMFIDEAHMFKNLFLYTKMRNVAGVQQTEAQKSSDLYMKCQYMDELTGGKGTVFATGTPLSNSMTELYTMMRYLQSGTLNRMGLQHFDSWASNFGETVTAIELAPEGTGYRAKTRFSKFFNLPELMNVFKEAADIKTADMLNLPVPKANFHNVAVDPSPEQKVMVADLAERAKQVHDKNVQPDVDNMLRITNDGRKIGLDQRLMNPLLPDDPASKVNACVNNVFDIYTKTADKKSTQIVFCDFSTPKGDGSFNLYDDIRNKLIARGVPKSEIAFIHEANTEVKKKRLFTQMRQGTVRVLIGSTSKCGAGTNVQDKLVALHHLDCPWRPADLEQREGRIIRQGNENAEVDVFRYVTKDTFDAYLYQMIENKQRFISQIMTSKSPVRSCEDVDEATLSYAEVKALCAGNPLIKEKMNLDVEVAKLKVSKANYNSQIYSLEDKVRKHFPQRIKVLQSRAEALKADVEHLKKFTFPEEGILPMSIGGRMFDDKEQAGTALLLAAKESKCGIEPKKIGEYMGFTMSVSFDSFKGYMLELKRESSYKIELGTSDIGNITRINNALKGVDNRLTETNTEIASTYQQLETAKSELGKPFQHETELQKKQARLAELNAILSMDNTEEKSVDTQTQEVSADSINSPMANAEKLRGNDVKISEKYAAEIKSDKKRSVLGQLEEIKKAQKRVEKHDNGKRSRQEL